MEHHTQTFPPCRQKKTCHAQGFTLIELSIVLTIIGLIVGGVLVGKDLIRAATLRKVLTEKDKLVASVITFRLQYNGIPGDLKNAEGFWGVDGSAASCNQERLGSALPSTVKKQATCSGNGNGKIDGWGEWNSAYSREHFRFWQHLSNAGLWPGEYTGATGGSDGSWCNQVDDVVVGQNMAQGPLGEKSVLLVGHYTKTTTDSGWYRGNYGNFLQVGKSVFFYGGAGQSFGEGFLTPTEAQGMDSKIDDGKPATGEVRVNMSSMLPPGTHAPCIADYVGDPVTSGAGYRTNVNDQRCNVIFSNLF